MKDKTVWVVMTTYEKDENDPLLVSLLDEENHVSKVFAHLESAKEHKEELEETILLNVVSKAEEIFSDYNSKYKLLNQYKYINELMQKIKVYIVDAEYYLK